MRWRYPNACMAYLMLAPRTSIVNSFENWTQYGQTVTLRNRGTVDNLRKPAVGSFVDAACRKLGTQERLANWLTLEGYPIRRPTVSRWVNGSNDPPSWVLFHIAAELELSLDEFAIGHSRDAERLTAVEIQLAMLIDRLPVEEKQAILQRMTSLGRQV